MQPICVRLLGGVMALVSLVAVPMAMCAVATLSLTWQLEKSLMRLLIVIKRCLYRPASVGVNHVTHLRAYDRWWLANKKICRIVKLYFTPTEREENLLLNALEKSDTRTLHLLPFVCPSENFIKELDIHTLVLEGEILLDERATMSIAAKRVILRDITVAQLVWFLRLFRFNRHVEEIRVEDLVLKETERVECALKLLMVHRSVVALMNVHIKLKRVSFGDNKVKCAFPTCLGKRRKRVGKEVYESRADFLRWTPEKTKEYPFEFQRTLEALSDVMRNGPLPLELWVMYIIPMLVLDEYQEP